MVGRDVHFSRAAAGRKIGDVVLEAEGVDAPPLVRSASTTVRAGEIVCLAGLHRVRAAVNFAGDLGARRRRGGSVRIGGKPIESERPVGRQACRHRHGAGRPQDGRPVPRHGHRQQRCRDGSLQGSSGANFSNRKAEALAKNFRRRVAHRDAKRSPDRWQSLWRQSSRRCFWPNGWRWNRAC